MNTPGTRVGPGRKKQKKIVMSKYEGPKNIRGTRVGPVFRNRTLAVKSRKTPENQHRKFLKILD